MSWWSDEAIGSLAALPGFPPLAERAARDLLSRTLESIFTANTEFLPDQEMHAHELAHELVAKMLEYDRWPGPAAFFQVARRLRFGDPNDYDSATVPHLAKYLPPAEAATDCAQCSDFGYRVVNSVYERCSCPAGAALGEVFLDMLNGRTKKQPLARPTLEVVQTLLPPAITQADIDQAMHERRVREALTVDAEETLAEIVEGMTTRII